MHCKFNIMPASAVIDSHVTILLDDGKDVSFTFKGAITAIGILSEFLRRASYTMEENFNRQPTSQGQNGTAGKPQVGECTTSAIG